jgi:hypothetical protein
MSAVIVAAIVVSVSEPGRSAVSHQKKRRPLFETGALKKWLMAQWLMADG